MVVISSFLLGFGGFLEVEWTWRHIAMVGLSCVVGFWDQNTPLWEERSNFRQKFSPRFSGMQHFFAQLANFHVMSPKMAHENHGNRANLNEDLPKMRLVNQGVAISYAGC